MDTGEEKMEKALLEAAQHYYGLPKHSPSTTPHDHTFCPGQRRLF